MAAESEVGRRTLLKGTAALGAGLALGSAASATQRAWSVAVGRRGPTTPPGWDVRRQLATRNQWQRGYQVWDGKAMQTPKLDQTRYLRSEVLAFLEGARTPFFLWFTPTSGHTPFEPLPAHRHDDTRVQ